MWQVLGHCWAEENARRRNADRPLPDHLFNMGAGEMDVPEARPGDFCLTRNENAG
jgi:hypothetical protein